MSKKKWIIGGAAVIAIVAATYLGRTLTGASSSKTSSSASGSGKVTTLKVAHTQNYVPYDFVDEKGESDGYEVAVLKAIDEKLPDYQFEYTGTSDEDLLVDLGNMILEPREHGTPKSGLRSSSFQKALSALALSVSLSARKTLKNSRPLMILPRKRVSWYQSLRRMLNGPLSKSITKSIAVLLLI